EDVGCPDPAVVVLVMISLRMVRARASSSARDGVAGTARSPWMGLLPDIEPGPSRAKGPANSCKKGDSPGTVPFLQPGDLRKEKPAPGESAGGEKEGVALPSS